jgi:hypothetical protein
MTQGATLRDYLAARLVTIRVKGANTGSGPTGALSIILDGTIWIFIQSSKVCLA